MKTNELNRFKLNRIIEYVRLAGFDYDVFDLEERGLDKILIEDFCFPDTFTKAEINIVWVDLYDLAIKNELNEVEYQVRLSEC